MCIDASSSEEDSSYFASLENKYKRNTSIPNGQTAFTLSLNVTKARLAIFPISEVRVLPFICKIRDYKLICELEVY